MLLLISCKKIYDDGLLEQLDQFQSIIELRLTRCEVTMLSIQHLGEQLHNLQVLDLSYNKNLWQPGFKNDPFPHSLKTLNLASTDFNKALKDIRVWRKTKTILYCYRYPKSTQRRYPIYFTNNLKHLNLENNNLTLKNSMQTWWLFMNLALESLNMSNNDYLKNNFLHYMDTRHLRFLDIQETLVRPTHFEFPVLETLLCSNPNCLDDHSDQLFVQPSTLRHLRLNYMGDDFFERAKACVFNNGLSHLDLASNHITWRSLQQFQFPRNLVKLNLSNNFIGNVPPTIRFPGKLQELNMSNNHLCQCGLRILCEKLPKSLQVLKVCNTSLEMKPRSNPLRFPSGLKVLDLSSNSKINCVYLLEFPSHLQSLSLHFCALEDKNVQGLVLPKTLQHLEMVCNNMRHLPKCLASAASLLTLDLSYNVMDWDAVQHHTFPPNLQELVLVSCGMHCNSIALLNAIMQRLTFLRRLNLSGNYLRGKYLRHLNITRSLSHINVSFVDCVGLNDILSLKQHQGLQIEYDNLRTFYSNKYKTFIRKKK